MTIGEEFDRLLSRAKSGDRRAFELIYRDIAPLVLGYLRANRVQEPDDVASEVFVAIVRNIDTFDGPETSFRSWVLTITHRRIVDDLRHRSRRPTSVGDADALLTGVAAADATDDSALLHLDTASVAHLLEVLTDDQRAVITLRVLGDLSIKEVSAILDKPITAVKSLQHRALASLAKELQRRGSIPHPDASDS
ncbi:MAG: RNA polymerase sigma factor [Acidimicrobiia bacterium]|nr:RNA polymerase sigma factor [Acidimicrobiia bacterium]